MPQDSMRLYRSSRKSINRNIFLTAVVLFMSFCLYAQKSKNRLGDLPSNPQAGHCYVKCFSPDGEKGEWKDIDCLLINYQKLDVIPAEELSKQDKKTLDKVFKTFIKNEYILQLDSYYTSSMSIEDNVILSRERAITIANYLMSKGMAPQYLRINALGPSNMKTGFWYRAINGNSDKWKYLEKEGIWYKTGED